MIWCHIKNDESAILKKSTTFVRTAMALQNRKVITLFYKVNESGYKQVLPGIKSKTLVYGEKTLFSEFKMEADSTLPKHSHPHEDRHSEEANIVMGCMAHTQWPTKNLFISANTVSSSFFNSKPDLRIGAVLR